MAECENQPEPAVLDSTVESCPRTAVMPCSGPSSPGCVWSACWVLGTRSLLSQSAVSKDDDHR